jgi:DNA-binding LacI/PurR family transcriptional regulator
MHDVARRAEVSHQTVSRVINDHPHVSAATRHRVEEAIAALGYRRNAAARSLVTSRSGVIGLLTPRTHLYGPTNSMIEVEVAAREAGYFVSLASVADSSGAALADAVSHFEDQAAEAVVLIAPDREWLAAAGVVANKIPVITMCADFRAAQPSLVSVAMDNEAGGRLLMDHLVALGHRDIVFVEGFKGSPEAGARRRAWRAALRRAGVSEPRSYRGDWTSESGYAAGVAMVADGVPTAVFCANDQTALGMLRALTEHGLAVPTDVSVVGFDDVPDSAYFSPPLTTVRQDFPALAACCVDLLDDILQGRPATSVRIRPELVERTSTAPPRRRGRSTR